MISFSFSLFFYSLCILHVFSLFYARSYLHLCICLCLYFTFAFLSICMHLHFCFFMYAHLKSTFYYIIYRLVHRVSTFFLFLISINSYIYFSLSSRFACLSLCKNAPTYRRCFFLPFYVRIFYVFLDGISIRMEKNIFRDLNLKKN